MGKSKNTTPSATSSFLNKVKNTYESVGLLFTIIDGSATVFAGLIPIWITSSNTLQWVMRSSAIGGAIVGYFLTAIRWKGVAWERRSKASQRHLILSAAVCVVLVVLPLIILNPQVARDYEWVEDIRGFLISTRLLPNLIVGAGMLGTTFCLISAFTLVSPNMKRGQPLGRPKPPSPKPLGGGKNENQEGKRA
jgi:hypothetical protein